MMIVHSFTWGYVGRDMGPLGRAAVAGSVDDDDDDDDYA